MAEKQKNEGKLQLLVQLPASLKVQFEAACRVEGQTMTEVITALILEYISG